MYKLCRPVVLYSVAALSGIVKKLRKEKARMCKKRKVKAIPKKVKEEKKRARKERKKESKKNLEVLASFESLVALLLA